MRCRVLDTTWETAKGINASVEQPLLPDFRPYVNRNLFSDYFLEELLPKDESWQVDEDSLRVAMQDATNLYAGREGEWSQSNEAQLERKLVRPMLAKLEHRFEVQTSLPTVEGRRWPDYAFFATDEDRREALDFAGAEAYFSKAIGIGDAKRWGQPLDRLQRARGDKFDRLNPSWQIDYYLRMSGARWGILTNGRLWRLYSRETSFRLDTYYEIDLLRMLAAQDLEVFKYFYLFFRRHAFEPDAEGLCFLDRVYQGSLEYARAVGDDLKENVYKALRLLAEGFLRTSGNDLDPSRKLEEIYANSLVLLYRLLFINYAEDRGLLPRDDRSYRDDYGLVSIEGIIAGKLDRRESLPQLKATYWETLAVLFKLINEGSEASRLAKEMPYVPPYNGGLFDPKKHPFLEKNKVADYWLARVIDLLARSQGQGMGKGRVDYSSLDVRHLGSIYEGLLEYKLRVADQEMVAVRRGGREQWIPASEAEGSRALDRVEPGSVYLATDRGERKATGSYYTPDYIVNYIVEHTVGPLIEQRMKEDNPIDGILSLKVLDPAMGSGHFLVEATDRLAHALVEALGATDKEPEEEDIRWARREVVERCIYGVDLNPLAVELAKLSLWLHTVAKGKPLNFLDHHLKVGNSLIGAWVEDLAGLPQSKKARVGKAAAERARQINLFEVRLTERLPIMLSSVLRIIRRRSDTLEDIKGKTAADQAVRELSEPFKAVADLWVSTYFGNDLTQTEYQEALEHVGEPGQLFRLPCVKTAREIAESEAFFHWELEFPEVYYEDARRRLNDGFDATIGNPPWGSPDRGQAFWTGSRCYGLAIGQFDCFDLFLERSLSLCRVGGAHGFVVPDSMLQPEHARARSLLIQGSTPSSLVRVGEGSFDKVFRAAFVYTTMKREHELPHKVRTLHLNRDQRDRLEQGSATIDSIMRIHGQEPPISWFSRQDHEFLLEVSATDREIMTQMEEHSISWSNLFWDGRGVELGKEGLIVRCSECRAWMPRPGGLDDSRRALAKCIHCGANLKTQKDVRRAQIVGERPLNDLWRPFIVGEAVNRYHVSGLLYIDTSYDGINYKDDSFFAAPKLLVRKTGIGIYATIDRSSALTNQVVYIFRKLPGPEDHLLNISVEYVLGVLCSRAMLYYYVQRFGEKEWRSYPYVTQAIIKALPIPDPFSAGPEAAAAHDKITELVHAATKANGPISRSLDTEIEDEVLQAYGLNCDQYDHMLAVLGKMQRLRIVRELMDW